MSFTEKCWNKSVTRRPIFLKLIFAVLAHTYRLASILILFPLNFTTKLHNLSETFANQCLLLDIHRESIHKPSKPVSSVETSNGIQLFPKHSNSDT